jgi:hypothetical protein
VVPDDLELNKDVAAMWIFGDGTYIKHGGLELCTHNFAKQDVERLSLFINNLSSYFFLC